MNDHERELFEATVTSARALLQRLHEVRAERDAAIRERDEARAEVAVYAGMVDDLNASSLKLEALVAELCRATVDRWRKEIAALRSEHEEDGNG